MARTRKPGVTARRDSGGRDVKDDGDWDEPIALREDAEECDEGARAAGLDALIPEELGQILRAWDKKRESDFAAFMVAHQQQTEAMFHGFVNRFALALSGHKVMHERTRSPETRIQDSSYSTRTCVRSSTVPYCTQ